MALIIQETLIKLLDHEKTILFFVIAMLYVQSGLNFFARSDYD
jgi:hypothetical protein